MTILETPPFDVAVTDHLLATTRSVRKRLDLKRPVEPEVIMECLNLAVQAPTASGVQRWRWLIVTDPDKRAALADLYREGNVEFQTMMAGRGAHESDAFYESANFLIDHFEEVPVHVLPCIVGRAEGRSAEGAIALYASIMPAAWSFMLALRSRGLGSVWTTLHVSREKQAAELLGIPDGITQVGLLPVAYTVGTEFKAANRQPADEVTYWNSWENVSGPSA
jgi:nitroreductase